MKNLMNLGRTENSKQVEYLNDIRDVGMSIVFGECDADAFSLTFEKYLDYIEKPSEYLQTIKKVYNMIHVGECTPDDLLMIMGKYTKSIEYEEPEIEYDCLCDIEDDDCDCEDIELLDLLDDEDTVVLDIDEETANKLVEILSKLSEE